MQVSIETTSELSRKMTVQVPEEKIQEQVRNRLKSMAGNIKLDGFRPGKVPQGLIQKRYGKGVREEVVAELIQSSFNEAVREEKLRPVAGPLITPETTAEGEGLKYVADFEIMPEFVLFPIELMEVDRFVSEVKDGDLDDMLLRLREQRRTLQPSENPAARAGPVAAHFEGHSEESVLPDLDAAFVRTFGIENGDVDVFRAEIKSSMEREMNRALNAKSKDSVMEALLRRNEALSLSTALVNEELKSLINATKVEAEKRKQTLDESVARQHLYPLARRRVALGLLISRIIETKQVALDKSRVRHTIEELALSYEKPEEVVNWYYSNRDQLEQVQNMVIEDQVVDLIFAKAKVSEKQIGFKELMSPLSQTVQG
jgi:trigger factor